MNDEQNACLYDIVVSKPDSKSYNTRVEALFIKFGIKQSDIINGQIEFRQKLKKLSLNNRNRTINIKKQKLSIGFVNGADQTIRSAWNPALKRIPENLLYKMYSNLKKEFFTDFYVLGNEINQFPELICLDNSVTDLRGKTSIIELISILFEIDLLITNDTGILHLAHFYTTPYIGIFGPTDAEKFAPQNTTSIIIQAFGKCAKCYPKPTCGLNYCELLGKLKEDQIVCNAKKLLKNSKIKSC